MSSLPNLQVLPQLLPGHMALYSLTSAPWMEAEKLEETQMLASGIPSLLQGRGWGPERGQDWSRVTQWGRNRAGARTQVS